MFKTINRGGGYNSTFLFEENAFDIARYIAAIVVVSQHLFQFCGWFSSVAFAPYFFDGVTILFTISGYLIPASYDRSMDKMDFLRKRFRRLYPALWIGMIFSTIFILLFYMIPSIKDFAIWLLTQGTVFQFYTGRWLAGYGSGCPNGALWTIPVEVQFYIFVFLFCGKLRKLTTRTWILIITCSIVACWGFCAISFLMPELIAKVLMMTLIRYLPIFLISMFIYYKKQVVVPFLTNKFWWLLLIYIFLRLCSLFSGSILFMPMAKANNFGWGINIADIALLLLTISFAYKIGRKRVNMEISYDIYLYHLIFINLAIHLGFRNNILIICASLIATVLLALSVKIIVERPLSKMCQR